MPGIFKKTALKKKKTKVEMKKTKEEIKEICNQIEKINRWFNIEINDDLIEACIHEREVLNARHRYLMNKIKFLESDFSKEN